MALFSSATAKATQYSNLIVMREGKKIESMSERERERARERDEEREGAGSQREREKQKWKKGRKNYTD